MLAISLAISSGCSPPAIPTVDEPSAPRDPWFVDASDSSNLHFTHDPGPLDNRYFLPQIIGSGGAFLDANGDGLLDIYLVQNGGTSGSKNQLFIQKAGGRFENASAGSGLDVAGYGMGVAVGDANNDGRPDIFLTQYGGDRLFLNTGDTKFREATQEANLLSTGWSTSASFFDYDRDGWLDLAVVNYLDLSTGKACMDAMGRPSYCHPSTFAGTVLQLYRNLGVDAAGNWRGFENRSIPSGVSRHPGPGLGILCVDLNDDGWPDIFAANDAKANHLWINRKDGTFKEEAALLGVAYNAQGQPQGNMGIAYGDTDGDGRDDLFVTHLSAEHHALWRKEARGHFIDRTAAAGLTRSKWRGTGFGTVLADFNCNSHLDLAIVNGAVWRIEGKTSGDYWSAYRERNQLFANDGRGDFRDISEDNPAFSGGEGVSRGLAVGDYDNDGALDLLVTQIGGKARLFRNVAPDRGHWLQVRALAAIAPRDAIGAIVLIRVGDKQLTRHVQPGFSYQTSNDPRVHFGLGAISRIEELRVTWPNGSIEVFPVESVDRTIAVREGQGRKVAK